MRVLVFTNMWPSDAEPWAGSFVADQVDDLRTAGVDVDVLAFNGRVNSLNYARASLELRGRVQRGSYDLVHAHYGLTGLVALSQRQVPVVTTFHGSDVGYVRWQSRISWFVARRTTPVFVNRAHARQLGVPTAAVIPAGVNIDFFHPKPRAEARRALRWTAGGHYILLPGARHAAVKGADLFDATIEIVKQRIPVRSVSLEGFSRSEVVNVMNAVDVVLVTSRSEGSPVAVKEALACGTPVVTVPVGDVPEVVADLPGCATCPREPAHLAAAVLNALTTSDRDSLRERSSRYARTILTEQLASLYRAVAG